MTPLLAFLSPSFGEMILIGIIALLLYGSDLPKVARTWGKTYQEFRKHLSGMQRDLNNVIYADDDAPPKLQYYPEFRDDAVPNETSDAVDAPADEHHSPVADAAMQAEEAAKIAAADTVPADELQREGSHGAA